LAQRFLYVDLQADPQQPARLVSQDFEAATPYAEEALALVPAINDGALREASYGFHRDRLQIVDDWVSPLEPDGGGLFALELTFHCVLPSGSYGYTTLLMVSAEGTICSHPLGSSSIVQLVIIEEWAQTSVFAVLTESREIRRSGTHYFNDLVSAVLPESMTALRIIWPEFQLGAFAWKSTRVHAVDGRR
jgi:hypothetical protein